MNVLPDGLTFELVHVGVAVRDIAVAQKTLGNLFGYRLVSGPFDDPIQKVTVSFLTQGESDSAQVELIAPTTADSPVKAMLDKNGGGAYHFCFETNDIEAALEHMRQNGCLIVSPPKPAVAFSGRRIAWCYTPDRQLFELVERHP